MTISRPTQIILAFAAVYLVWGSTYLAIRIVVHDLPPVLSAGARFIVAGPLLLAYALATGARLPTSAIEWRNIVIAAFLMLVGGNGLVQWSEQWIESNQAALIVATSALWMAGIGTLGASGEPLRKLALAGLLLGFAGVAVLVGEGVGSHLAPPQAYLALLLAPMMWAMGSVFSRRNPSSCPPIMAAALQMCVTGVFMTVLGLALGEGPRWNWHPPAIWALAYLIVFGSCIAYGAYVWLVHQVTPSSLGTYAYINPAIAVLLGWWLLDEHLGRAQIAGTAVILAGVVLVTLSARRKASH